MCAILFNTLLKNLEEIRESMSKDEREEEVKLKPGVVYRNDRLLEKEGLDHLLELDGEKQGNPFI